MHRLPRAFRRVRFMYHAFHQRHGKHLAHVGKMGIFGEMTYHFAEINGMHHGVIAAAVILLVISGVKVISGDL